MDVESYSTVNLTKSGVYSYTESPNFELLLLQYAFDDGPVVVVDFMAGEATPQEFIDALDDPAVVFICWNANFERTTLAKHFNRPMPPEKFECAMVKAATLGMPLDLDRAGRALKIKNKKHSSKPMRFFTIPCKPTAANGMRMRNLPHHDPDLWQQFLAYGKQDVEAEREIYNRCCKIPVPADVAKIEHELWCLDQRANDRGVRIDLVLAENAVELNAEFKARCHAEAVELTGLANPNSVKQLIGWLNQAESLDLETLNKKQIPPLLASVDSDVVRRVLELRLEMAKTSTQKYVAMQNRACADDFFRGGAQFYGARTGRWGHRGIQLGNLPHNKVADILEAREMLRQGRVKELELLWGVPSFILSQLIRTAFIPDDDDSEFLVVDFSAIEARMTAWCADEEWQLEVFRGDGRLYETTAERMFELPRGSVGKKSPYRQKGKVAILACSYGGGEGALVNMGALEGGLLLEELKPLAYAWRDANLMIAGQSWRGHTPGLWEQMETAALGAVRTGRLHEVKHGIEFSVDKGILFLRLPSGRKLAYMQPRVAEGRFGNPCVEFSGLDQKTNQWTRLQTFGGLWVENLSQAACRDLLRDKILRIDKIPTYRDTLRFTVHDELVLSVPRGRGSVSELEEIMSEPVSWAPGLPLRAEGFATQVYCKEID